MVSFNADEFGVSLKTMNIDATKLLYALRPLINSREVGSTSLGLNNILYIALILLLIKDDTIKTYLPGDLYRELEKKGEPDLLQRCYDKIEATDGYALSNDALKAESLYDDLYSFLSDAIPNAHGSTILAVEEPEAHLHPIYQRLLYKHVMNETDTSVIITTHSTHISSVAPITSLVHLIAKPDGTCVRTTAGLRLSVEEYADLSRYIDVKRGELYTAKGILFVEGIAEEYLITSFAKSMGFELDRIGLVVCNINSTDFQPYCRFIEALGIPYVIITDGDYYYYNDDGEKLFGSMACEDHKGKGFDGLDRAMRIHGEIIAAQHGQAFDELGFDQQREAFAKLDMFIGEYTLEVEIFSNANAADRDILCSVFNRIDKRRRSAEAELLEEPNIGKVL